jgi:O-antigen/teichoic acid export membrane protein
MKLISNKTAKIFAGDLFYNTMAFGMIIASQQLLALPKIAASFDKKIFAEAVILISVMNVLSAIFGNSIGNTRILVNKNYHEKNLNGDFVFINHISNLLVIILSFTVYYFVVESFSIIGVTSYVVLNVLASFKNYIVCEYRMLKNFKHILYQSLIYLFGLLTGMLLSSFLSSWVIIFIIPEFLSVLFSIRGSMIIRESAKRTILFKDTLKTTSHVGLNAGITSSFSYFDRFLIYPILGPASLGAYFSATAVAKMGALIINPASNVLLPWLSNSNKNKKAILLKYSIFAGILTGVLYFLLVIIISPYAIKLLYPQFYEEAKAVIVIVCLSASFGVSTSIYKPVIMTYCSVKHLTYFNIIYSVIFFSTGILFSIYFGLYGFAVAMLISRFIMWLLEVLDMVYFYRLAKIKDFQ